MAHHGLVVSSDCCREALRSPVAPCRSDCFLHSLLARPFEIHAGRSAPPPRPLYGHKNLWFVLRKVMLLLGRELDHSPTLGGMAKRGENFPVHAEVRMVHVCTFDCFRKK